MPRVRPLPLVAGFGDAVGKTLELFDERQPHHDRHRPRLAERERRGPLVGDGKLDDDLEVDAAGGVFDQFTSEEVDARIPAERTLCQLRQLEVVLPRQVLPDLTHLVLDDMVVVAQPLFGADTVLVGAGGGRQHHVGRIEPV